MSLADKTHNARAILRDYRALGDSLWSRFSGGREGTLWYYQTLATEFTKSRPGQLANEFAMDVQALLDLAEGKPDG